MASCENCLFYSKSIDEQHRDFNDIGDPASHFCPMYQDAIPPGVFDGLAECEFFTEKDGNK